MKNIVKYSLILAAAFGMSACSGALDRTPDGNLSLDEVFADAEKTPAFLSTCYDNIPKKGLSYYWFENMPTAVSDEAWSCDDVEGIGAIKVYKGTASASDCPFYTDYGSADTFNYNFWESYWKSIRYINIFLSRIPTATVYSEADRKRYTAEAHVLRAFYYLQLVKWFGPMPIMKEPMADDFDYSTLKKSTAVECFKFIIEDCQVGLDSDELPWRITSGDETWRMRKGIAAAIQSQAAVFAASPLYNGGEDLWEWAYQINKNCFESLTSNGYELYTQMQTEEYSCAYAEYFAQNGANSTNPVDRETIWQSPVYQQAYWWVWGLPVQSNYRAGDVPSQELVDSYDMLATGKPVLDLANPYLDEQHLQPNYTEGSGYSESSPYAGRDPRFEATVIHNVSSIYIGSVKTTIQTYAGGNCSLEDNSRTHTRTGYYVNKARNWHACSAIAGEDGRWKYFRLGEVYLNYAEAAAEAGHITEAMKLVNDIRHRAGFDPSVDVTASGKDEAVLLVRHERRVELAYEENRFFDVRRWTTADQTIDCEKYCTGMKAIRKGLKTTYERFLVGTSDSSIPSKMNYEAKWHFLPIPVSEASRLESLTGDKWQNAGW